MNLKLISPARGAISGAVVRCGQGQSRQRVQWQCPVMTGVYRDIKISSSLPTLSGDGFREIIIHNFTYILNNSHSIAVDDIPYSIDLLLSRVPGWVAAHLRQSSERRD